MFSFAIDYYLTVSMAAIGVVQIAAAIGGLRGLVFFRSNILTRLAGAILLVAPAVWFFSSKPRNINDYDGGLDANEQAIFFALGSLTALVVTLTISSLVNFRMRCRVGPKAGLDALENTTYARAVLVSLRCRSKQWRI